MGRHIQQINLYMVNFEEVVMESRNDRVKNICRIILFCLCVLVLVSTATVLLKPKRLEMPYDNTKKERGFYAEPKNSLDIVFVGSSQLFSTIIPDILWEEYGITSYVFGGNEQTFSISYYYIMEALKYQKPKAIVLETAFCNWGEAPREAVVRINFDDMRWGKAKISGIINNVTPNEWQYYFFELSKYHSRWSTLSSTDFQLKEAYCDQNLYKGWSFYGEGDTSKDYSVNDVVLNCTEIKELNVVAMQWLDKIIDLCEKNEVELVLLKTPNNGKIIDPFVEEGARDEVFGMPYYNKLAEIAQEKDILFLNMNLIMAGENHNNQACAQKATLFFGEWIEQQIELEDKRNNSNYAYWDNALGAK